MSKTNDRPEGRPGQYPRPKRLTREQYDTAWRVRMLGLGERHGYYSHRFNLHFNRLLRETGLDRKQVDRGELRADHAYKEAICRLVERDGRVNSLHEHRLRRLLAEWWESECKRDGRGREPKPEGGIGREHLTACISFDCDYWRPFGVVAGDSLTLTPAGQITPRRIVVVQRLAVPAGDDGYDFDIGRFVRLESGVTFECAGGEHPGIVLELAEGDEQTFNLDSWTPFIRPLAKVR
jgi:hypothetical protein